MNTIKIKVKDQFEAEKIATAKVKAINDQEIPFFKRIEHIEVEGEILLPNMDLLFENPKDGSIYRYVGAV
ncbi:hypothetical protein MMP66_03830 [Acinetobacter dispersus]|uniref:hypothetical protein n=1 Tax=Acinetobacter dispersus TaxID=70348 RepID=UPI0002D0078C|nr:hypothetical protein [Acinetobacter dispersus]ENX51657.1 hypothetical protein F901_02845 [Acinetobacter dispersus]MCH7393409.1 hypothetical protein [Acinetobacter dispersus]